MGKGEIKFREGETLVQGHSACDMQKRNNYYNTRGMDSTNIWRRMKTSFVPFCFPCWGWGVLGARTQLSFLLAMLSVA